MPRFKVQPIELKTQNTAPYTIVDIGDNENIEVEAQKATYLTSTYPERWVDSVTKLPPVKSERKKWNQE